MTKAELKRRLVPGTKLTLVNCMMGPCNKHRTVVKVMSTDVQMLTPEGTHSYMTLNSYERVEATENGFKVILKAEPAVPGQPARDERLACEYQWGHMYNHVGKV